MGWYPLYVKNFHVEQVLLIWWQVDWENKSETWPFPESVSDGITQVEQVPMIRRQLVSEF